MVAELKRNTNTTPELQAQSEIIKSALLYLSGMCDGAHDKDGVGFNGADSEFGHKLAQSAAKWKLSPRQEFEACKMMRKYWRQLKKSDIILPKPYLNHYSLQIESDESAVCTNESKGSSYALIRDGFGDISCECEAFTNGNKCGHVAYAENHWGWIISESIEQDLKGFESQRDAFTISLEASLSAPSTPCDSTLEILPGIIATNDQAKALDELDGFVRGDNSLHLLSGFAGCGKTLLLQAWIKRLRESGDNRPIVFTAPTNKATEVLRVMVEQWKLGIECITCAKLLGLRPVINQETGKEEFKKNYAEDSRIQEFDIVVVDECSMVASELFEYIAEEANLLTKILFVGDWAQLPPVGEPISKAFMDIKTQSHLKEVKRYSGSIAVVAEDLRSNLGRRGEPLIETNYNEDGTKGTFVLTPDSWETNLLKAFRSEKSQLDPNYCRALAWRNKTVESLNEFIRNDIRGKDAPRFVVGERLLATEHYGIKDAVGRPQTLFNTSAEMEVREAMEGSAGEWLVWFLTVQMLDSEGKTYTIPVLHEDEVKRFESHQKKVKQQALKGDRSQWQTYYENRRSFAWVDYAYSMTVHKSQGSTFQNVFVNVPDILVNKTKAQITLPTGENQLIYERNQLLYVALTRASHRIFIFE